MALWLRVLAILPEDPRFISQHLVPPSSSSRGSDTLFWSLKVLHTCGAQTHAVKTHTWKRSKAFENPC